MVKQSADPRIFVIVLNWNGHDDTRACLTSLDRVSSPGFRVVVVDNDSSQPGIDKVMSCFPEVELLRAPVNLGFAGGNNLGIRHALSEGADIVILLNNDTLVAPDFARPIVRALTTHNLVGAASGKICPQDGSSKLDYGGGHLSRVRGSGIRVQTETAGSNPRPQDVTYITGCFMALSRDAVAEVGLLDEDFFFGVEDLDYSWRLLSAGYRLLYVPESVIWHEGGASRLRSLQEIYRGHISKFLLMRKHLPAAVYWSWFCLYASYIVAVNVPLLPRRLSYAGYAGTEGGKEHP